MACYVPSVKPELRHDALALLRLLVKVGPLRCPLSEDASWDAVAELRDRKLAIWCRDGRGVEHLEASVAGHEYLGNTVPDLQPVIGLTLDKG